MLPKCPRGGHGRGGCVASRVVAAARQPEQRRAQQVSLWQNNLIAVRATRYINWQRRNDAGVAVLTDVSY